MGVYGTVRNMRIRSSKVLDVNYRSLGRGHNGKMIVLWIVLTWFCYCGAIGVASNQKIRRHLIPIALAYSLLSEATTLTNKHNDTLTWSNSNICSEPTDTNLSSHLI